MRIRKFSTKCAPLSQRVLDRDQLEHQVGASAEVGISVEVLLDAHVFAALHAVFHVDRDQLRQQIESRFG